MSKAGGQQEEAELDGNTHFAESQNTCRAQTAVSGTTTTTMTTTTTTTIDMAAVAIGLARGIGFAVTVGLAVVLGLAHGVRATVGSRVMVAARGALTVAAVPMEIGCVRNGVNCVLDAVSTKVGGVKECVPPVVITGSLAPGGKTLVWVHGGGFLSCSPALWMYQRFFRRLVQSGAVTSVLAVNYEKAPAPAPARSVLTGVRAAIAVAEAAGAQVALGGDSAGGNLLLYAAHQMRWKGALVLMSPWVDLAENFAFAPNDFLPRKQVMQTARVYAGGASLQGLSPLHNAQLIADMSEASIFLSVGGDELFCSQLLLFAQALRAAGCKLTLLVEPGCPHVYPLHSGAKVADRWHTALQRFL